MTSVNLRGLAQANLWAEDVAAARDWYTDVLGVPAYFQRPDEHQPAYVEFRLGKHEYELGIVNSSFQPEEARVGPGGAVVRWHVDDIRETVKVLLAAGARPWEPVIDRDAGFLTASVLDPFGNILGLIQSPHYVATFGEDTAISPAS